MPISGDDLAAGGGVGVGPDALQRGPVAVGQLDGPLVLSGHSPDAFMGVGGLLNGGVVPDLCVGVIAKLRREVKANSTGYGTPNGNFINVGCMMPYMDYTPRTLDEIIEGDARYHEENPDAL